MDEKLEQIIKESAGVFFKYGIKSISMDDIARELGISKKTLYLYVKNKTDLVQKILDYNLICQCNEKDLIKEKKLNAIAILLEVSKMINKHLKQMNPSVTYDLQKYYPDMFKNYIAKKRDELYKDIKKNIEQGIAEGLYRDDLNVELIARLYIKKLENIHDPEFLHSDEFNIENIFEVMFESHIRGISNKKGIAFLEKQKITLNFNL